jgi:hypothetical protein
MILPELGGAEEQQDGAWQSPEDADAVRDRTTGQAERCERPEKRLRVSTNEHTDMEATAAGSPWQQTFVTPLPYDPTRGVSPGRASVHLDDGLGTNTEANLVTVGVTEATQSFGPANPAHSGGSNSDGRGGMGTEGTFIFHLVYSSIAHHRLDEAITPPSVMMREYWERGEWELLNLSIS